MFLCTTKALRSHAGGAGCWMNPEDEAPWEEMLVTSRAERGQKDQLPHSTEFQQWSLTLPN